METKSCIECKWCETSIWNFFRVGSVHGCIHPEVANPVTGKATNTCEWMRRAEWRCQQQGVWFEKK